MLAQPWPQQQHQVQQLMQVWKQQQQQQCRQQFSFAKLQVSTLDFWQVFWNAFEHKLLGNEWLLLMAWFSAFTKDGVDVEPACRHQFLMGEAAVAAADSLFDGEDEGVVRRSSSEVLEQMLQRMQDAGIQVAKRYKGANKRKPKPDRKGEHIGYDWLVDIDLPFLHQQQAPIACDKHPQTSDKKFAFKQRPDAAHLRVNYASTAKLESVEDVDKALEHLFVEGEKKVDRLCLAHLRRVLVWQLTREQYENLEVTLGDLWPIWQQLAPLPPSEVERLGQTLTAQFRAVVLNRDSSSPQQQQQHQGDEV